MSILVDKDTKVIVQGTGRAHPHRLQAHAGPGAVVSWIHYMRISRRQKRLAVVAVNRRSVLERVLAGAILIEAPVEESW